MEQEGRPLLQAMYYYVTGRCNLKCEHCWLVRSPSSGTDQEITLEEFNTVIDQACELGLRMVRFTGGEPLIKPNFPDYLRLVAARGLRTEVETNGVLLTARLADLFVKHGTYVGISLDSMESEVHDKLRGMVGCHAAVVEAIKMIRERGVSAGILSVLFKRNIHTIQEVGYFAHEMGVKRWKITPVSRIGRGKDMADRDELLSPSEVLQVLPQLWELSNQISPRVLVDVPPAFYPGLRLAGEGVMTCGLRGILGLLPDGRLSICGIGLTHGSLTLGRAPGSDLPTVWKESRLLRHLRRVVPTRITGICGRCMLRNRCLGKCRVEAYLRYGRWDAPFPFCQTCYDEGLFPSSRVLPQ